MYLLYIYHLLSVLMHLNYFLTRLIYLNIWLMNALFFLVILMSPPMLPLVPMIDLKRPLTNFRHFHDFRQYNTIVNINNRLLDLIFANMSCAVTRDLDPLLAEDSHHPVLAIVLVYAPQVSMFKQRGVPTYNFRRADYPLLYRMLGEVNWSDLDGIGMVEDACRLLYNKLHDVFDLAVPKTVRDSTNRRWPAWFTREVKDCIRMKENMRAKHKRTGSLYCKSLSKHLITEAYNAYMNDVERSLISDPSTFWAYVRTRKGGTRIPGLMTNGNLEFSSGRSIVDAFSDYFESVYIQSDPVFVGSDFPDHSLCLSVESFSLEEVEDALKRAKNTLTARVDGIASFLLGDCAFILAAPLLSIFNLVLSTSTFPSLWKESIRLSNFEEGQPC
nr:uncharacterized protein LOC111413428 [Onthophagus taurus]